MLDNNNVLLSQEQANHIVNLLLTHTENCREVIKTFFVPEATEALEEEVKVCKALLDVILPQLSEKEKEADVMPDVATIASEMQKDRENAVNHCVNVIMQDIAEAVGKGETSCQFSRTIHRLYGLDMPLETDVILAFEKAGYNFEETSGELIICWEQKRRSENDNEI